MIIGKVVRILSEHEIVISVGMKENVKRGMEFVIFSEAEHIFDPSTGEDLGAFEIVKGRVSVTHVMDNMSRAKTLSFSVEVPSMYDFARSIGGARKERRLRKLQVRPSDVRPIAEDVTVSVGDSVRSVDD
jgi:hypothetical protein